MEQSTSQGKQVGELDEPSNVRLFLTVFCANVPSFVLGTTISWTSPMMPKLRDRYGDGPLNITPTKSQEGWIFSLISIGAGLTAYFAGHLADRYGRKLTLVLASCMFAVSYSVLTVSSQLTDIYIARIFQGIGAGFSMTVVPLYIGEIAPREKRGSAGSFMMLFMTLGQLYDNSLGPFISFVAFQMSCLLISLLTFVGYLYMPESPHYLIANGRIDDAAKSLQKIRGQNLETVQIKIKVIQDTIDRSKAITKGTCKDVIHVRSNRRAMIIVVGLMLFQQLSGSIINVVNSQTIFAEASSVVDPRAAAIIVGVVQVLSSVTLQFFVDWHKRRTLLKVSAIGMCLAQFSMGTLFFISASGDASKIRWVPIVAKLFYNLSYRIGFGPLPFTILGELCPPNIKAIAAPSVTLTCWGMGFLITQFYPILNEYGSYYIFWSFSFFCACAFVFTHFVVIETRGLSLSTIQDRLQN